MKEVTILSIGDELLYGYTINSNAAYIAQELVKRGTFPIAHRVVSDDSTQITHVLNEELKKERVVIATGGLDMSNNIVIHYYTFFSVFLQHFIHSSVMF